LWKWNLRYLITEMRLETSKRPSSWWLPWGHLLWLPDGLDNNTRLQGPASSATRRDTGQKAALHLTHHQDPVHNVARVDTGRTTALLCLWKVGQSPTPTQQSEGLSDLLGLVAEDWCGSGTSAPFKITSEEPRVAVQVAGRPQTPTWCYLTFQVSFILHRSLWWGWTVSSTSQNKKQKTSLFVK
jgi:hypothetical protein